MRKNEHKYHDELTAWDLNAGCRQWIDQSTPARRRLKKKLRKIARKTLDKWYKQCYNESVKEEEQ